MRYWAHLNRSSTRLPAALLWLIACSRGDVVTRTVTPHLSSRCALPMGNDGFATFRAEGDFQSTGKDELVMSKVGATLAQMPESSRALVSSVVDPMGASWVGLAPIAQYGDVDVLLWPSGDPCALVGDTGAVDVGSRTAGVLDSAHVLSAGGFPVSSVQPQSFVVDLTQGTVRALAIGPTTPRANATITAFSKGAVLAGGFRSDDPNGVLASAELYDSARGDFDGKPITLGVARAKHGAVTLADGKTLLIGGVGGSGALGATELVDPIERRAQLGGMPILKPRVSPMVARLASGQVLVAGGFDANGPVQLVELLSSDGRRALGGDLSLKNARSKQAMVALEGGGALFVFAPDPTDDPTTFQNVTVLSANRTLVDPKERVQGALTDPRLFRGADGAPVLWTGDRWLVWDPWHESFSPLAESFGDMGPAPREPVFSPDPGLLAWISNGGDVIARRVSTRDPFTSELLPLLLKDTTHLAPDSPFQGVFFDSDKGLALAPGTSAFVSDARFAGVALDVDATEGVPIVVLRSDGGVEVELGGGACPWPPVPLPATFHVELRNGALRYGSGVSRSTCTAPFAPNDRFAVGLRGGPARAKNLRVSR